MPRPEDHSRHDVQPSDLAPFELPPELAEFLRESEYAMLTHESDKGTVFVVKAPGSDIRSVAGSVPIEVKHELYQHPLAPVIRTVVRIFDQPESPLALESFINVADESQWAEYADLSEQGLLTFLFYDEQVRHQLTKQVHNGAGEHMRNVLNWADRIRAAIPEHAYNFDQAKVDVMRRTGM